MTQTASQSDSIPNRPDLTRYRDPELGVDVVQILPGDYYVTARDEVISTVLGSCISVCLRDPVIGVGGINHFMLPGDEQSMNANIECARYGVHAMEVLITSVVQLGANKDALEVKMFGGGNIISGSQDLGERNIKFARDFLKSNGFIITSEDVGLLYSRKIRYQPSTGAVMVKRLRSLHNQKICTSEENYVQSLIKNNDDHKHEIFD